jgi:hypothetical protein
MKAKLTPEAAQAATNLRANKDFAVLQEWILGVGEGWNQATIMADDPDRRAIGAGMCRGVYLLAQAFRAAPQILNEMKQNG